MAKWKIFVDESCNSGQHQHMVFGGVIIRSDLIPECDGSIAKWRENGGFDRSEFKWTKIASGNCDRYKTFVSGFLTLANSEDTSFRCTVFDQTQLNFKMHFDGSTESGYYMLMYQFLLHCFLRNMKQDDHVNVYLDQRSTGYDLDGLLRILNLGLTKLKNWLFHSSVVRSVEYRNSAHCNFIQLADVFSGAVACENNDAADTLSTRGYCKQEVIDLIKKKADVASLCTNTPFGRLDFKIWKYKPSGKAVGRPSDKK